jgi:hypothetical protein
MEAHLDWHYRANRKKSEVKRQESRKWYSLPINFLTFDSNIQEVAQVIFPTTDPEPTPLINIVCAPSENVKCSVCFEELEKEWDPEMEEFILKSVVKTGNEVSTY